VNVPQDDLTRWTFGGALNEPMLQSGAAAHCCEQRVSLLNTSPTLCIKGTRHAHGRLEGELFRSKGEGHFAEHCRKITLCIGR